MSSLHALGVLAELEKVADGFLAAGLTEAQKKSWTVLEAVRPLIKPGIDERELNALVVKMLKEHGSPRSWHRPNCRIGVNTRLYFSDRSAPDVRLGENDVYSLDIGPTWLVPSAGNLEYEGDVGDTYVVGHLPDAARCAESARALFRSATETWRREKLPGPELYRWMAAAADRAGFTLLLQSDGHRLADFPHKKYSSKGLGELPFTPSPDRWVLEVQLLSPCGNYGAFFEDVLC